MDLPSETGLPFRMSFRRKLDSALFSRFVDNDAYHSRLSAMRVRKLRLPVWWKQYLWRPRRMSKPDASITFSCGQLSLLCSIISPPASSCNPENNMRVEVNVIAIYRHCIERERHRQSTVIHRGVLTALGIRYTQCYTLCIFVRCPHVKCGHCAGRSQIKWDAAVTWGKHTGVLYRTSTSERRFLSTSYTHLKTADPQMTNDLRSWATVIVRA